MYLPRCLQAALHEALRHFPAVLVTGPRQSGKTTFLRQEAGEHFAYVSFDDPFERTFARDDPRGFLDRFGERPVILDEVQHAPELLSHVKLRIDADRDRRGRWILTGSQQLGLMGDVSESLAGRVAVLELLPLSDGELGPARQTGLAERTWVGGYPEPALRPAMRDLWVSSYLRTYVERDVRQLRNIGDLRAFHAFLGLCAARHGQLLNMADLSRQLGTSGPTVKDWLSVLEASYVVRLVPPWSRNYGKRITRAPKLFFVDPALASALTRQPSAEAALAGPLGGPLLEGWIVSEVLKAFAHSGRRPEVYHWRSHGGLEVDLLVPVGPKLLAIEVKLTATPRPGHLRPLERLRALLGDDAAAPGLLVCRVKQPTALPGGGLALPWCEFGGWLRERIEVGSCA